VELSICSLVASDAPVISSAFSAIGWKKPVEQYLRYASEQDQGTRVVKVARVNGSFAGYVTVVWSPGYEPFARANIPAIQDLNVLPDFRRRGVASALLDHAEALVQQRSDTVGIGVGMDPDYGPAQRLYVLRGYVPDGRGLTYDNRPVRYGDHVRVDDSLVLHLTKRLLA